MRAVVCKSFGPPAQLVVEDVATPELKPGHVRLRVHGCGIGFPDALMMIGKYQVKPELPFIPGTEIAGVVTEVASDVTNVPVGTRVLASAGTGGLAEEAVVSAQSLIFLPDAMTMAAAAGFLVNYGTTYHALVQRAKIQPGETMLVLGAAGGVGLTAVELGKVLGARVLAGASTAEKMELAKQHGADAVFNYTTESIKAKVMEFTGDKGIDVVYDPVGADVAEQSVRSMAWNGRYLVIGFAGGKIPAIPLNLPLLKGCSLVGVFWGAHARREPGLHAQNLKELFQLYTEHKIKPHITEIAGLEGVNQALDLVNGRRGTGKVVIRIADGEG
jgi:NADPH2:quinone reductase